MKLALITLFCCFSFALSEVGICNENSSPVVNVYNNAGCDESSPDLMSSKLDAISEKLADIEKQLNSPAKYSDWEVVFRANSGAGGVNLLELWKGSTTLNDNVSDAKNVDGSFVSTYKSSLVEEWGSLNIKKVKFAFYDDGIEVMTLIFNGVGSNKMNWFTKDRILQTPYPDMLTSTFNFFAVDPEVGTCPECRQWYISKNHGGCPVDAGWVAVTSLEVCVWDRAFGAAPRFVYSSTGSVTVWESESPSSADVMAISIQTGSP